MKQNEMEQRKLCYCR